MKRKLNFLGIFALMAMAFAFVLVSCQKDDLTSELDSAVISSDLVIYSQLTDAALCGEPAVFTLWGGQDIDVGTMKIGNDEDNLYVTYQTSGDWYLAEVHLYVLDSEPESRLTPGHAPYKDGGIDDNGNPVFADELQVFTFVIPLADFEASLGIDVICDETVLWLQAHAAVTKDILSESVVEDGDKWKFDFEEEETAYGGDETKGQPWYANMSYLVQCCNGDDVPWYECETAFAYGTHIFGEQWVGPPRDRSVNNNPDVMPALDIGTRWGWAINMTDPGKYESTLYSGAGQNDTDKGTAVGDVTIDWVGEKAEITIDLYDGYSLWEVHIYAGTSKPTTTAPGQYGNTFEYEDFKFKFNETFEVEGDEAWFIIHAVVCEGVEPPPPCVDEITLYGVKGTNGRGGLYAIEIIDGSFGNEQLLIDYTLSGDTYSGNGLAFDEDNNRLYFAVGEGTGTGWSLYFYDFGGTDQSANIHLAATGLPGQIYGATWGDGKYWFIRNGTQNMSTVIFDADGKNGSYSIFETGFANMASKAYNFGDISMDSDGVIYASSAFSGTSKEFFKYDTTKPEGERYEWITTSFQDMPGKALGLQLGFAADGNLYGVSTFGQTETGAQAREWFLVNTEDGTVASLGLGVNPYNDLSTGPSVLCE